MAGAYTAKPELPWEPWADWPDFPLEWWAPGDPSPPWEFPGPPHPPGYEPEYTITLSLPSSISPESQAAGQSLWVDRVSYAAGMPIGGGNQRWTAKLDGQQLYLREGATGSYYEELYFDYGDIGDFYGVNSNLGFQTTRNDFEKIVTVSILSEIDDTQYDVSLNILIDSVKITGTITDSDSNPRVGAVVTYTSVATSQTDVSTTDGNGDYQVDFTLEEDASGYTVNVSHVSEDNDIDDTVLSKEALGDYDEDFQFLGGWYARIYFNGWNGADANSSFYDGNGNSISEGAVHPAAHAVISQTGVLSDMAFQVDDASPPEYVSLDWSSYKQLTPAEWASLDGTTWTMQTYFTENYPGSFYNGVHETTAIIRVYNGSGVQQQAVSKENDLLIGLGVTDESTIPAFSISGNVVTVL